MFNAKLKIFIKRKKKKEYFQSALEKKRKCLLLIYIMYYDIPKPLLILNVENVERSNPKISLVAYRFQSRYL